MKSTEKRSFRHCQLCGRRLWGGGWVYAPNGIPDGQSIVVCDRCQETAPRCAVCGRPMGAQYVTLPDGRSSCAYCHQTAVYELARGQALFERVAHVVADELGLRPNVGTEFTLADYQHLQRLVSEAAIDPGGDASKVVGLFVRKGRRRVMYILSGLPQILLIQTVAHEWAHAWQGENCPLLQDPLVREGFAEWVAYKTLQAMGAIKKTALMEQEKGLYGQGLRRMLELEQHSGPHGVLEFCRRAE